MSTASATSSTSEAQVQAQILLAIGSNPAVALVWRNNSGALRDLTGRVVRFGQPGSADILAVVAPHGRLVGIEVKGATGRQRPEQKAWQAALERVGGIYCLARSVADAQAAITAAQSAPSQSGPA